MTPGQQGGDALRAISRAASSRKVAAYELENGEIIDIPD